MHRVRVAIGLVLAAVVALAITVLYIVIARYMALIAAVALIHAADGGGGVGSVSAGTNEQIAYAVFLSGWAVACYCVLRWVASTEGAEARRWWRLYLWLAALAIAVAVSAEVAVWWFVRRPFDSGTAGAIIDEANVGVLVTIWAAANRAFLALGVGQIAAAVLAVAMGLPSTPRPFR